VPQAIKLVHKSGELLFIPPSSQPGNDYEDDIDDVGYSIPTLLLAIDKRGSRKVPDARNHLHSSICIIKRSSDGNSAVFEKLRLK
jgi:hypothetical protein